jgi:hypothetical protein
LGRFYLYRHLQTKLAITGMKFGTGPSPFNFGRHYVWVPALI